MDQVQHAGEALFQASSETDHVDVFVGHSWRASRWSKFLALCLFFNLEAAIRCACGAWFVLAATLVGWGGVTGLGGSYLILPCLVYFPIAVFFLVFFFRQQLFEGRQSYSVWVDRLCIHQTDMDRKAEQIAALPVFVMHSSRMLILWDETYFDRKWCSLELATFARHVGTEQIDVLPLWLAPWLLNSILMEVVSLTIYDLLDRALPRTSIDQAMEEEEPVLGRNAAVLKFVAVSLSLMISGLVYAPLALPSFVSFRMKLQNHQLMLRQMANFDVRAAKCTLPSDVEAIEQHVEDLFKNDATQRGCPQMVGEVDDGEVLLPTLVGADDPLGRFNAYVRGTLRSFVLSQIGDELYVSRRTCLMALLPMVFYASVNVLGCDNGPCETSGPAAGYTSLTTYMITSSLGWVILIVLALPLAYPVLLRLVRCAMSYGDGSVHFCAALLCPMAFCYSYTWAGFACAALVGVVQDYSPTQLIIFLLVLAALVAHNLWLFAGDTQNGSNPLSCRCIKRQTTGYETLGSSGTPGVSHGLISQYF
ncbi:gpmA [Symbiodinium natans]|uniref:GpmA protein n=1 Tax=Symbiodinium natans TaxID=878477 RepID=A0A812JA92_9DINO|nr:gpmA [Symbiodinium natans]